MTGLFLRYCWRCNSTATMAEAETCPECGHELTGVTADSLIERLGHLGEPHDRRDALEHATSDDLIERSDPRSDA